MIADGPALRRVRPGNMPGRLSGQRLLRLAVAASGVSLAGVTGHVFGASCIGQEPVVAPGAASLAEAALSAWQ